MSITGEPDGPPSRVRPVDRRLHDAGWPGWSGCWPCLMRARTTGQGCDVDTCLFDVALHQLGYTGDLVPQRWRRLARMPRSSHFSLAPVQTFPTADGWIFVMCMTQKFWAVLVSAMGRADLLRRPALCRPQHARTQNREALSAALDPTFRKRTTAEWLAEVRTACCRSLRSIDLPQALDNPFSRATGMVRPCRIRRKPRASRHRQSAEVRRRAAIARPWPPLGAMTRLSPSNHAAATGARMKLEGISVIDLSSFLPGPVSHDGDGRSWRRGHQGRAARRGRSRPPHRAAGRRDHRFLPQRQPRQEKHRARSQDEQGRDDLFRLCDRPTSSSKLSAPASWRASASTMSGEGARNPGIVYCSISAFGQNGPYLGRAAHDLAIEAMTGVLSITLGHDDAPAIPGIPVADMVAACRALRRADGAAAPCRPRARATTSTSRCTRALMAACANVLGPAIAEGRSPSRSTSAPRAARRSIAIYETSDGRQLVLGGQEMKFVRNLLGALGKPELAPTLRMARRAPEAGRRFPRRDLQGQAVGALDGLAGDARHLLRAGQHPARGDRRAEPREARLHGTDEMAASISRPAVRFKDEPSQPLYREPLLGEHTDEILGRGR